MSDALDVRIILAEFGIHYIDNRKDADALQKLLRKYSARLVTEREAVERERAAFVSGWMEREDPRVFGTSREWAVEEAARRYPLPKEGGE